MEKRKDTRYENNPNDMNAMIKQKDEEILRSYTLIEFLKKLKTAI